MEEAAVGAVAPRQHAKLAQRLCARNTGIGADGIEFLDRRANGNLFLRLFNSDGSEAELSGNGTRCVAAWLAHSEGRTEVALGTHGGVRTCRVVSSEGVVFQIESGMGVPRVMARTLDLTGSGAGLGLIQGAMVNVGNPHFVLSVATEDFSAYGLAWEKLGEIIATSPIFPHGTNVEFVRRGGSPAEIEFRIYERGCGPTMSSGTGTCASATASIALWGASRELTATALGGAQRVVWPGPTEPMLLTGPAEIVCVGEAPV
jgi:diaminopimelate epimerase